MANDIGLHSVGARPSVPITALLTELHARGQGFDARAIDPRIGAIVGDGWRAANPRAALKISVDTLCRRAPHEVATRGPRSTRSDPTR